jgi:hypothetical protein
MADNHHSFSASYADFCSAYGETVCPYAAAGYADRKDYLLCLAEDHGMALSTVKLLADMLGPEEDFDGLVTMLEDYAE